MSSPRERVRYFLTDFGRCTKRGGPMRADDAKVSYDNGVYACAWRCDGGPASCATGLRRPVATVDEAVINCIKREVQAASPAGFEPA
ncbi:hypothetical protein [Sorangium sp. So ce363]|uniref:hypothetical protein n=1 Tax=Sorangium sp. So ce363 TaxID=3133304 RepID=UPI003F63D18F